MLQPYDPKIGALDATAAKRTRPTELG